MRRCLLAVIQLNTKYVVSTINDHIFKSSPKPLIQTILSNRRRRIKAKQKFVNYYPHTHSMDKHYGENAEKPDLSADIYLELKSSHMQELFSWVAMAKEIERETIHQSECSSWHEKRKFLLTASNFGQVIAARKDVTSLKSILKLPSFKSKAMEYGKINESLALKQLSNQENICIEKCGLFIDKYNACLGASPDGLIDNDGIVEIKCPFSAAGLQTNSEAFMQRLPYLKFDKIKKCIVGLKKKHKYYYQIQGQLNICEREYCLFAIWTSPTSPLYVEKIYRDINLWNEKMVPKLTKFYAEFLLPEILDSRVARNMPLRTESVLY